MVFVPPMMVWNAAEAPFVELQPLGAICGLEAISAAPKGLRVLGRSRLSGALAKAPTAFSSLTAFGSECFATGQTCEPRKLSSISGLVSPAWSRDGETFYVIGGDRRSNPSILFRYRWEQAGVSTQPVEAARFRPSAYRLHFSGAVDWPSVSTGISAIEAGSRTHPDSRLRPLAASWSGGQPVGQLWFRLDDQSLWALNTDSQAGRTSLTMADVLEPHLALDNRSRMLVSDTGFLTGKAHAYPDGTGVVDASSGHVVGTFKGRTISMMEPMIDIEEVNAALQVQTRFYIASVQYVPSSHALFVLLKDAFDGSKLILFRPGLATREVSMVCGGIQASTPPPTIRMDDWGEPARALPVWTYSTGHSRRLVIFFHGGPGGQGLGKSLPPLARVYLGAGYDVAMVEYSGSKGAGLTLADRLAKEGFDALERDSAAIRAQESRLLTIYDEIGLHAESYGAMYGVGLRLERAPVFTVFVAPWLRYRDPSEWLGPDANVTRIAYQRRYEQNTFGWTTTDDLVQWSQCQTDKVSAWRPSPQTFIILADRDRQVPPKFVKAELGDRDATIIVLPGVGHDGIAGFKETTIWLERFLLGR